MGLFDDLDNAFDQLLSPSQKRPEKQPVQRYASEDPIESAASELKAALAEAQKTCVNSLLRLLEDFPRAHALAAIHGSLQHLAMIDSDPAFQEEVQSVLKVMTTKRGATRKRLSRSQLAEICAYSQTLPKPTPQEQEQARSLLTALSHQRAVSAPDFLQLYRAGIWQADQFKNGTPDQLSALSGLPIATIDKLKGAVNLS